MFIRLTTDGCSTAQYLCFYFTPWFLNATKYNTSMNGTDCGRYLIYEKQKWRILTIKITICVYQMLYGGHRVHGLNLEVLRFDFSDFNASFQSSEAQSICLPNYYVFQLYLYSYQLLPAQCRARTATARIACQLVCRDPKHHLKYVFDRFGMQWQCQMWLNYFVWSVIVPVRLLCNSRWFVHKLVYYYIYKSILYNIQFVGIDDFGVPFQCSFSLLSGIKTPTGFYSHLRHRRLSPLKLF